MKNQFFDQKVIQKVRSSFNAIEILSFDERGIIQPNDKARTPYGKIGVMYDSLSVFAKHYLTFASEILYQANVLRYIDELPSELRWICPVHLQLWDWSKLNSQQQLSVISYGVTRGKKKVTVFNWSKNKAIDFTIPHSTEIKAVE